MVKQLLLAKAHYGMDRANYRPMPKFQQLTERGVIYVTKTEEKSEKYTFLSDTMYQDSGMSE